MLVTLILLIAMLGAIILATGSVEEGKTLSETGDKNTSTSSARLHFPQTPVESRLRPGPISKF